MNTIYSLTHLRREAQHRIDTSTDPLHRAAFTALRNSLIRQDTLERHRINTSRATPIRCGLQSGVASPIPDSNPPHWSFSTSASQQQNLFNRTREHFQSFFSCVCSPTEPIIQKMTALGGWKKGLKAVGLGFFTQLGEQTVEQKAVLKQVLEKALEKHK